MSANSVVTALQRYDVDESTDEFEPRVRDATSIGPTTTMSLLRTDDGATNDDRGVTTSAGDATTIKCEASEGE